MAKIFTDTPMTLEDLATVLGVSAGIQKWALVGGSKTPLKTSPSGGARHPIECYVVVRNVAGLKPAIYHYASERHRLERIGAPVSIDRMRAYVPQSPYFANASAMVFFTAVFARQLWRYTYSRAYRAALIEAGHVCQTFLLTATSLGLAPYCVMGLADTLIERDLGIDGITESVLYCAGVGRPPRGTTSASLPRGVLKTRPNRHLSAARVASPRQPRGTAPEAPMAPSELFAFPFPGVNPDNNHTQPEGARHELRDDVEIARKTPGAEHSCARRQ